MGCGWFGLPCAKALINHGYQLKGSTTTPSKIEILLTAGITPYLINLNENTPLNPDFFATDVLLVNIPPKAKETDSVQYIAKLEKVAKATKQAKVKHVIFISSTGVFEDGNFEVDENTIPQPHTATSKTLWQAEELFKSATAYTTTIVRLAGLIGPGRNLAKFFAGKTNLPNGKAPINLIELQDAIGIILQIFKKQLFGDIYHGVTPHHPTRASFYGQLCIASGMEKAHFRDELLNWKQINSVKTSTELDYSFNIKNWDKWLTEHAFS